MYQFRRKVFNYNKKKKKKEILLFYYKKYPIGNIRILALFISITFGRFTGSLLQLTSYSQFAGNVYVMEAVSDHMVLTFCSPNTQFYSMILARKMIMDIKDLRSITNNITDLKLPITQTKRTCRSSSTITQTSMWLIATFCLTHAYLRGSM